LKIGITADSTCDFPKAFAQERDIHILPLYVVKDDGSSFRDGVEISIPEVFAYARETGKITGTAAVTVGDYIEKWTELRERYDAIIHVAFSSEMSACCGNARIAAQELENIYVVDSLNLSTAYGLMALEAAEMRDRGAEPAEIVPVLERMAPRLEASFVIDTLDFLRRGGRCSALKAMGANMLRLKPCIEIHDGKMSMAKKYRGKIENVYLQYVRDRLEGRDDLDLRRIFITGACLSEEVVARTREEILRCQPFGEVLYSHTGCTVSSHCGPLCMGLMYCRK